MIGVMNGSAEQLVRARCFAVQNKHGRPPSSYGVPVNVFRKLVTEMRGRGCSEKIFERSDPSQSYVMLPLWDLEDGLGVRICEVFPDSRLDWGA